MQLMPLNYMLKIAKTVKFMYFNKVNLKNIQAHLFQKRYVKLLMTVWK